MAERESIMTDPNRHSGYNGRVLSIDLTHKKISIEECSSGFLREYLGGGLLGTYYVLKRTPSRIDPLSPENTLVFSPSVITGAPVSGASRFNVTAKSPLTGAIGDTQCGGGWGPRLKYAGFDAVVVTGRAEGPVYILIDQGDAQIRDASHLWGKETAESESMIRSETGDDRIEIAQIGRAGENRVRFAGIAAGLSHFAGRTGMGSVMGSKNLKAIAVRGKRAYTFHDEQAVKSIARQGVSQFKESAAHQLFQQHGTAMGMTWYQDLGMIVTRNFQSGQFDNVEKITGKALTEGFLEKTDTCLHCAVRCKRVVKASSPYPVDPRYGGPEYENISMLGSNLDIDDLAWICKANEICNKHTMDAISTGGMIAFAMECFENGLISEAQLSGLELPFGNKESALTLIEMIAKREGVGDLLADGYERAIAEWGEACRDYAIHVKNMPLPAHMPRIKPSQALMYAVNPFGPDHMSSEHDWLVATDSNLARSFGITEFDESDALTPARVKATMLSQFYYSLLDTLTLCMFCWGPSGFFSFRDLEDLISAVTGWRSNMWELMRAGERRVQLMQAFNYREGIGRDACRLPERMYEPLPDGRAKGKKIDRLSFESAKSHYCAMMGWDPDSMRPSPARLDSLGLNWVNAHLEQEKGKRS
jgi:aldehyde:ferredoxin oxidoreductase